MVKPVGTSTARAGNGAIGNPVFYGKLSMRTVRSVMLGAAVAMLPGCIPPDVRVTTRGPAAVLGSEFVIEETATCLNAAQLRALRDALGGRTGSPKVLVTPSCAFRPRSIGAYTGDEQPTQDDDRLIAREDRLDFSSRNRWEANVTLTFLSANGATPRAISASKWTGRGKRDAAMAEAFAGVLRQIAWERRSSAIR